MDIENIINVNVDALCVLKFAPNSNLTMVDYEPISRPLDPDFEQLKLKFSLEYNDAKSILSYVKNHYKLKVLLENYNYCSILYGSFQGFYSDIPTIEAKYQSNFPDYSTKDKLRRKEKEILLIELQERLQAYYNKLAYKICEEKRIQKTILAYSHRKVGWGTPKYELNPNFSIELKTNFGYGASSYFFVRIKYKEIDIIPFSDWIKYRRVKQFEIIRYSARYQLNNQSWIEAMEYSRDACNLSLTNEVEFVRRYVIEECERMITGLENFLEGDKFKFLKLEKTITDEQKEGTNLEEFEFLNWKKITTDDHKEGQNLIEFRGEKISGALEFITKIIQFEKITGIKDFVNRIEICNTKVQPMLKKEVLLIEQKLIELNENLNSLKPIYEDFEKRNTEYDNKKIKLREKMISDKEFTIYNFKYEALEKRFKEQNIEYESFEKEYKKVNEKYKALTARILSFETTLTNIEQYIKTIETYFETKSLQAAEL